MVQTDEFRCPYANMPLNRPCEVGSCMFNLKETDISRTYKRCFLNYQESLRFNPYSVKRDIEYDYNKLSQDQRNLIVGGFFDLTSEQITSKTREFYMGLFTVMAEGVILGLTKYIIDPVPYQQCVCCGVECDHLFYPKSGVLPAGWGYCTYACFQLKPPPILLLEKNLEVDFLELIDMIGQECESSHSRAKFIRQIIEWVLGHTPMS